MAEHRKADIAPEDDEPGECVCGEQAVTTVHLSGEVVECDQGFQHQTQITVGLCELHDDGRLSGKLDGRLILAAAHMKDKNMAALILEHEEVEPNLVRVTAKDTGRVTAYEPAATGGKK
jgi:hypothetical protein